MFHSSLTFKFWGLWKLRLQCSQQRGITSQKIVTLSSRTRSQLLSLINTTINTEKLWLSRQSTMWRAAEATSETQAWLSYINPSVHDCTDLTNQITLWTGSIPEKLIHPQLISKAHHDFNESRKLNGRSTVAAGSRAGTVFGRSNTRILGSIRTSGLNIRVRLCLCCPVCR
jgi:hypothetical protein